LFPKFSATSVHEVLNVPLRRLDDAFTGVVLPGRVVIKLDVEGNELSVLRGARRLIREARPRVILEINSRSMEAAGTSMEQLRSELAELGFRHYVEVDALEVPRPVESLEAHRLRNIILLEPQGGPSSARTVSAAALDPREEMAIG
jgi:hypothetical protein